MSCYCHGLVNTVINQPWVQDTMHVAATTDVPTKWEGMNVATQFRRSRARTSITKHLTLTPADAYSIPLNDYDYSN